MSIDLSTPVLEALKDPQYKSFMYSEPEKVVGVNIWWVAWQNARNVFSLQETVIEAWNQVALLPAIYCWKQHEIDGSGIRPCQCDVRNNASCGHPQETKIFHAYGLAWMIATQRDPSIEHPWTILRQLVGLDYDASDAYGTFWDNIDPTEPALIPGLKKEIQAREKSLFMEIILPWRLKVSEALTKLKHN